MMKSERRKNDELRMTEDGRVSVFSGLTFVFVAIMIVPLIASAVVADDAEQQRPNILWLSAEDISPHFGCYGDPHAITPNIDQLAEEGVLYSHAYTTAGVCAPCRSGIITGMYQTTLGTHHMRCNAVLPDHIKPFPGHLREAGYYCTNNSKTDYQFKAPRETWDQSNSKAHWRNRDDKSKPFFSVFNFTGCHESGIADDEKYQQVTARLKPEQRQDPSELTTLPPYYPDTPVVREDWKRNYELITAMDAWAGDLIQQLKEDGLYEDTIIFFWSDHGVGLPRAKRWLYESGTHIPLVARIPERFRSDQQGKPGTKDDQLVSSIDFGPTVLNLAGLKLPDHMQGRAFLGNNLSPQREYIFGARDRMDERYDIIRMVRDKQFRYIRNYEPLKTYYQYMNTPEKGATMQEIRRVHSQGKLPAAAAKFMSSTKPVEELYDVKADPHEINNLADDPKHAKTLERLRAAHLAWVVETRDIGLIPEPIIEQREHELKTRFEILRQNKGAINQQLGEVAAASSSIKDLDKLLAAMSHKDEAIRWWGATGIGNLADEINKSDDEKSKAGWEYFLKNLLTDESPTVRISAGRALARLGKPDLALPLLIDELYSKQEWVRLHAAIVLDEMDEDARPALKALSESLKNQPNKYIVRVANRAINELQKTDNKVP